MKKTKTDRKVRRGLFSASHSNGRKFFFGCYSKCVRMAGKKGTVKAENQPCEFKSMTDLYDLLDAENDATKAEGAQ